MPEVQLVDYAFADNGQVTVRFLDLSGGDSVPLLLLSVGGSLFCPVEPEMRIGFRVNNSGLPILTTVMAGTYEGYLQNAWRDGKWETGQTDPNLCDFSNSWSVGQSDTQLIEHELIGGLERPFVVKQRRSGPEFGDGANRIVAYRRTTPLPDGVTPKAAGFVDDATVVADVRLISRTAAGQILRGTGEVNVDEINWNSLQN